MPLTPADLLEAQRLCAEGSETEALKLCGDFIAEHPDHPLGYHMRALVRTVMGNGHLALADRDKVVSLRPGAPGAYMARADDHLRLHDFAAAAADLDRAQKYDDGHYWPMIPLLRAHCVARLGRFEQALAECDGVPEDYLLPGFAADVPASARAVRAEIAMLRARAEQEDN